MKEWMSEEIVETLQLVQNDAGIFFKDAVNFVCWWFAGMPVTSYDESKVLVVRQFSLTT